MAWLDDYSVDFATGDIRHVSGSTRYPVIDMHRGLITLAGQATASGDDLGDITDLFVPSRRASDTDITLNDPMNIDATAAQFMYGGSVTYGAGASDKYSGLAVGGSFNADALPQVFANNLKLANYWGFSYSPDAALGYAARLLIKSRTGGVDIDGGRVRVQSRGYGYIYREASTVLGSNESVASLGNITVDSFNSILSATIATYTDIVNTEGYHTVDCSLHGSNGYISVNAQIILTITYFSCSPMAKCHNCGLFQTIPALDPEQLKELYETFYNFGGEKGTIYTKFRELFFGSFFYRFWMALDGDISFHSRKGRGRLLDVGCNEGRGTEVGSADYAD